ncbi:MAG: HPP family protein [Magnetococcales bacterium]|nr:HPP family protein [Magnetococcales bacterium]MBF0113484.1 HPP family protein [Magnetococcales bacterium]
MQILMWSKIYLQKMRGGGNSPPAVSRPELFWSGLGAFLGIGLVGFLEAQFFAPLDQVLLIGSFGASAVLLYGAPSSPLAQPRNLLGGHLLSALVGVLVFQLAGSTLWLASALAVALAIVVMHLTRTLHPPGGATALIAVIGSETLHRLGFLYALVPVGLGAVCLLLVALLVNNLATERRYPVWWW